MYRSTDGGETWTHLGLHETRAIGRVVLASDRCRTSPMSRPSAICGRATPSAASSRPPTPAARGTRCSTSITFTGATDVVDGSARSESALRRDVSAPAQGVRLQRRRPGQRDLQDAPTPARRGRSSRTAFPPATRAASASRIAQSKPDVLIATIEHPAAGGTYRTEDAGATWKRMSAHQSAADVLQQADHRSEQRQARLAARRRRSSRARTAARRSWKSRPRRPTTSDSRPITTCCASIPRTRATSTSPATAGCTRASTWARPTCA